MEIYKNSSLIVNQSGDGAGSFTVTSIDVVYSTLSATSPDFTYVEINDSVNGVISACSSNSANVNSSPGYSYTTNASIDGVAINYIVECPF
jgi:methionine aminopeptidase